MPLWGPTTKSRGPEELNHGSDQGHILTKGRISSLFALLSVKN